MARLASIRPLVLLVALSTLTSAVTPQQLANWFSSSGGLAMDGREASNLASLVASPLTQCGVTVSTLQVLKDVLYDHSTIDLGMADLRKNIIPLAEHHVSPDKLKQLYNVLSSGYSISGGLGLPKDRAQKAMLEFALNLGEPDQLKALYQVMYGYSGLGFSQAQAQETAIALTAYGADDAQFKESYRAALGKGATSVRALQDATEASVKANMQGLVRRYAKDATAYTAEEFEKYYPTGWLKEWDTAPQEKRLASDKKAYTASQFSRHFGSAWAAKYRTSQEATQRRLAEDGKTYSVKDFQGYYHDQWQSKWSNAPELACAECAPYIGGSSLAEVVV
mmetsp:Transcript_66788/g.169325  ORF Transcript_66788/g.169325 Transcript_66788/m.169325 type:complete len:336 (+) Transcript_66788:56-1063(+)|eukprot:CAMPEP_0183397760 /NCGR_PEP_ID=MMETSP0370-20130417/10814_1 /TAXON_ID=268820 /ORGANISM="Peridinium aciculiferum, Strain PAER-2" /LENGTH=335 /DNA_ID=CAMNT_0025578693 /DNA_START=66 /DNA_END=1073 /DNA_ORIENTATION=-